MSLLPSVRTETPERTGRRLVRAHVNVTRCNASNRLCAFTANEIFFSTGAMVGYSLESSPESIVLLCLLEHFICVPSTVSSTTSGSVVYCAKLRIAFAGTVIEPSFSIAASKLVTMEISKSVALTMQRFPSACKRMFPKIGRACCPLIARLTSWSD